KEAKAIGADSYYLIHNHPSGNPTPSGKDIESTVKEKARSAEHGMTFKGSLVLNGDSFFNITPDGKTKRSAYNATHLHKPGTTVIGDNALASMAKKIVENSDTPATIVFFDTQRAILNWHPIPPMSTAREYVSYISKLHSQY